MTVEKIIQIMCPNLTCRRVLAVPESARGRTVRCKGCNGSVRVPTRPAATQAASAPILDAGAKPAEGDAKKKGDSKAA